MGDSYERYISRKRYHFVVIKKSNFVLKAVILTEDCNVISVDYEPLATSPWYFIAVVNAKAVGRRTGRLLSFMMDTVQLSPADVHVIGKEG